MKKYEEGDVIYANKKTYVCELASETKAVFQEKFFGAFGQTVLGDGSSHISSVGTRGCNPWLVLKERKCPMTALNLETGTSDKMFPTDYVVIGKSGEGCSTKWDLTSISRFPELLSSMSTAIQRHIIEEKDKQAPKSLKAAADLAVAAVSAKSPKALKKATRKYTKATKKAKR